ncbi:Uncharacterized protein BM_BM13114 [Brugia malayi]|uniref:Bm13114, isoform b n=1 Tax=Brugia malayi TaxID=6279 RepID=A0A4E9FD30_BRUMA|nr:Uncharacterized protein BM_BM13114 [Brugia malayi]VIO94342.1 Uncharacterized protein BM_BM13114 [Brugia malayi]
MLKQRIRVEGRTRNEVAGSDTFNKKLILPFRWAVVLLLVYSCRHVSLGSCHTFENMKNIFGICGSRQLVTPIHLHIYF